MPKKVRGRLTAQWEAAQKAYARKVHTFARNSYYLVPGGTVEDMEQELLEVLFFCVFDYDPGKGASFNTFFQQSARNRISSIKRFHNTQMRKAEVVSLDDDDVMRAIEQVFLDESPESIVIRRMAVTEYVVDHGTSGLRQLLHRDGTGALLRDDDEEAS